MKKLFTTAAIVAFVILVALIVVILVLMIVHEEKPPESELNWTKEIQKEYTGDEMAAADKYVNELAANTYLTGVEFHLDREGVFREVFHYYAPAQDGKPNGSIWIYTAPQESVISSVTATYSEEEYAPEKLSLSEIESLHSLLSAKAVSYLERENGAVSEAEYIIYAHLAEVRAYTKGEYDPNSPVNGKSFYDKETFSVVKDESGAYYLVPTGRNVD